MPEGKTERNIGNNTSELLERKLRLTKINQEEIVSNKKIWSVPIAVLALALMLAGGTGRDRHCAGADGCA